MAVDVHVSLGPALGDFDLNTARAGDTAVIEMMTSYQSSLAIA